MAKSLCYTVTREDERISDYLNKTSLYKWSPEQVMIKREVYDEAHPDNPININNVVEAATTLKDYELEQSRERHKAIYGGKKNAYLNLIRTAKELKILSYDLRKDAVSLICFKFSEYVDKLINSNPNISREEAVKNEDVIFEQIYGYIQTKIHSIKTQINELTDKQQIKEAKSLLRSYNEILKYWPGFVTIAKKNLYITEGVKLGTVKKFGKYIKALDSLQDDLDDWQEEVDRDPDSFIKAERISSFKSASQTTRALLRSLYLYEYTVDPEGHKVYKRDADGNYVIKRSRFGVPQTMNAVAAHTFLGNLLTKAKNASDVIKILKDNVEEYPFLSALIKEVDVAKEYYDRVSRQSMSETVLNRNKSAAIKLSNLYIDFNKTNQLYARLISLKNKKGALTIFIENRKKDSRLQTDYKLTLDHLNTSSKIYTLWDADGNIKKSTLAEFINDVDWFKNGGSSTALDNEKEEFILKYKTGIRKTASDKLYHICLAMGIPVTRAMCTQIVSNPKLLNPILKNLKDAYKGITNTEKMLKIQPKLRYENFYRMDIGSGQSNSNTNFTSHLERFANNVIRSAGLFDYESQTVGTENKVKIKNSKGELVTMYGTVNPGYLSQFIKDIQIRADNQTELRAWLDENYAINPAYCDFEVAAKEAKEKENKNVSFIPTKKFRLRWLNDLYNGNNKENILGSYKDAWLFAQKIEGIRVCSNDKGKPFEDFSPSEHLETVFTAYFTIKRQTAGEINMAYYPIFISGDANQFKTITAPIYKFDEIIEGLTDIFYQELELQRLEEAADTKMKKAGISTVRVSREFALVPEFNDIFKDKDITHLADPANRKEVISLLKDYYKLDTRNEDREDDAYHRFRAMCVRRGVGTINDKGKYVLPRSCADATTLPGDLALHDLWMNYNFATIQQMSLMTTTPAFYKNVKDLQKRYKETHSSGIPLNIEATIDGEYVLGVDERGNINTNMKTLYITEVKQNTENWDPKFMEAIAFLHGKDSAAYKAYTEVESMDGQAYRTIDSYRKVMKCLERWSPEMESFYQDYKKLRAQYKDVGIPDEEIIKLCNNYKNVQFQPLKPFMFTHEKYALNDNEFLDIPVQIKCSEALIIPELLPKNSRLRDLIEYCSSKEIDVVAATSAVKVGAWGQVDITKAANREQMLEILSNIKDEQIHKLSYKNYLLQNNVPAHDYTDRLFATQIRKLILGGKYEEVLNYFKGKTPTLHNGKATRLNGKTLRQFFNELICANFIDSVNDFIDKTSSTEKIVELLAQTLTSNDRDALDDILGLDIIDDDLIMPLCEGIQEYSMTSNLIAVFKKMVNKQTILGGSGVQVSSYGINDYNEDKELQFVTSKDGKNLLYAQVIVPLVQTYKDANGVEREVDYDMYCELDGTLKTNEKGEVLIDLDFPGIRDFIAYRIPTERDYSIINCRAVKFTRPQLGGTIKVPSQCTKISGFDFDIDKLYFMFTRFEKDKDGNWIIYHFDKRVEDNPKFTRDNMLIEIIKQRLMDPDTAIERTTPGGFEDAKSVAKLMYHLLNNPQKFNKNQSFEDVVQTLNSLPDIDSDLKYNYNDLETLIIFNEQNQLAAKLIGIFANQNTNHVYSSGINKLALTTPIAFGKYADNGLFDLLHAPVGIDTFNTLAQFLAASVDAVKEPVLNFLNLNTFTASAACMLGRLGYDMYDIGLLLNQPIIRHICDIAYKNNSSLDTAINNFLAGLDNDTRDIDIASPDRDELLENLITADKNSINSNSQIGILKLFMQINGAASELNLFVNKTKFTAANAIKPNFGNYYALQKDLDKFNDLQFLEIDVNGDNIPIKDTYTLGETAPYLSQMADNPFAFEQCMYDCMKKAMNHLLKYYPYDTPQYKEAREYLSLFSRYNSIDEKTINWLHRELPVFLLSNKIGSPFYRDGQHESGLTNAEYYLEEFPKRLEEILYNNPELLEYPLFQFIEVTENSNHEKYIKMNYATDIENSSDVDAIKDSWEKLLTNNKQLAIDLFMYNFFQTGFGYGPSSFIRYAPETLKEKLEVFPGVTYADFWKSLLSNSYDKTNILSHYQIAQFFKLFLMNHPELNKYTLSVYGNIEEMLSSSFKNEDAFADVVQLSRQDLDDTLLDSIAKKVEYVNEQGVTLSGYIFTPILKFKDKNFNDVYYIQSSFDLKPSDYVTYERFEPLGESNKLVSYGFSGRLVGNLNIEGGETEETPIEKADEIVPTTTKSAEDADIDNFIEEVASLILSLNKAYKMLDDEDARKEEMFNKEVADLKSNISNIGKLLISLRNTLQESTSDKKKELIEKLIKEAEDKQLMVLDEDGNLVESC